MPFLCSLKRFAPPQECLRRVIFAQKLLENVENDSCGRCKNEDIEIFVSGPHVFFKVGPVSFPFSVWRQKKNWKFFVNGAFYPFAAVHVIDERRFVINLWEK